MTEQITVDRLDLIYTGSGLLVLWLGWIIKARPKWKTLTTRVSTALDVFVGRGEEIDEVTGTTLAEIKPLHRRLTDLETAVTLLAEVQASQTEQNRILVDHEARIVSLEDVETERYQAREESAAMWRAIANKDTLEEDQ